MQITSKLATEGYSQALNVAQPAPGGAKTAREAFASVSGDFMDTMRTMETQVTAGLAGRADAHSVVQALAQTEIAVQTAVAVRDKVVEAYQEILRMPV
jgi:flagellar hook-basal body complex protein FliE